MHNFSSRRGRKTQLKAIAVSIIATLLTMGASAKTSCDIRFGEGIPDDYRQVVTQALTRLSSLELSDQSDLHKSIFGLQDPAHAGDAYCSFLQSRITYIEQGNSTDIKGEVASNRHGELKIGDQFMNSKIDAIMQMATLIHEARHTALGTDHDHCPTPFLDKNGQAIRSLIGGEPLENLPVCDSTPTGAYGIELVWLGNIARFCTNCTPQEKQSATTWFQTLLPRIINPKAKSILLNDFVPGKNPPDTIAQFEKQTFINQPERFRRVSHLKNASILRQAILSTADISSTGCSGVFISETGYMVTALHCLDTKFFKAKKYGEAPTAASIMVSHIAVGDQASFWVPVLGNKIIEEKATIVFAGKGWPDKFPDHGEAPSVLKEVSDNIDDFVILKFDSLWPGQTCAPVNDSFVPAGQEIWAVGFPQLKTQERWDELIARVSAYQRHQKDPRLEFEDFDRQNPEVALDKDYPKYVSSGFAFKNFAQANAVRPYVNVDASLLGASLDPAIYMTTTGVGYPGMSGGGIYDAFGKLVAINSIATSGNFLPLAATDFAYSKDESYNAELEDPDFHYGLVGVRLSHIVGKVREGLGAETTRQIFSCGASDNSKP